jgi:hypothetical protein
LKGTNIFKNWYFLLHSEKIHSKRSEIPHSVIFTIICPQVVKVGMSEEITGGSQESE